MVVDFGKGVYAHSKLQKLADAKAAELEKARKRRTRRALWLLAAAAAYFGAGAVNLPSTMRPIQLLWFAPPFVLLGLASWFQAGALNAKQSLRQLHANPAEYLGEEATEHLYGPADGVGRFGAVEAHYAGYKKCRNQGSDLLKELAGYIQVFPNEAKQSLVNLYFATEAELAVELSFLYEVCDQLDRVRRYCDAFSELTPYLHLLVGNQEGAVYQCECITKEVLARAEQLKLEFGISEEELEANLKQYYQQRDELAVGKLLAELQTIYPSRF